MPLSQGEAQTHARNIRAAAADLEHVASLLPLVAMTPQAAPGTPTVLLMQSAINSLEATKTALLQDVSD